MHLQYLPRQIFNHKSASDCPLSRVASHPTHLNVTTICGQGPESSDLCYFKAKKLLTPFHLSPALCSHITAHPHL
eukprot:scaffold21705_cov110-Skeletonema_marinoi.AAC.2